jgi:hypothetical protein
MQFDSLDLSITLMNNLLQTFGITRELLDLSPQSWQELESQTLPSTHESILSALDMIVPVPCGHDLIRVGPNGDGGYLVPDDLKGVETCFSPGTCNSKGFEDDLAINHKIKSFMCDYSSDIEKFKTPIIEGYQFFEKKWLDVEENEISVELNSWISRNSQPGSDLILQMDIEGYEYKNLIHCSLESLNRFRVVVLEIHHLYLLNSHQFLNGVFVPAFKKLIQAFCCVHVHPNNCCPTAFVGNDLEIPTVLELTFIRKDRLRNNKNLTLSLPHRLDVFNDPMKRQITMPNWITKFADQDQSKLSADELRLTWLEKRVEQLSLQMDELKKRS